MSEIIDRLVSIYGDLKQQYNDNNCPIMILSAIDEDDLDFLRTNINTIW